MRDREARPARPAPDPARGSVRQPVPVEEDRRRAAGESGKSRGAGHDLRLYAVSGERAATGGIADASVDAADSLTAQRRATVPGEGTRPNRTGLPDRLKTGIEAFSGLSLDDVRVHRDSAEPAKMNAHAFARGNEIHLAPGQEKHLAHEAWHVVQQKQRRVKATHRLGSVAINDDPGLEREADSVGARAAVLKVHDPIQRRAASTAAADIVQRVSVKPLKQSSTNRCWAAVGYAIHLAYGNTEPDERTFVANCGSATSLTKYDKDQMNDIDDIIGSGSKKNLIKAEESSGFYKSVITKELNAGRPIVVAANKHYVIITGRRAAAPWGIEYMEPGDGSTKTADAIADPNDAQKIVGFDVYTIDVLYYTA